MRQEKITLLAVPEIAADEEISFVGIEEFILVAKGRNGFLMAPHVHKAWKESGEKIESTTSWMKLEIKIHGANCAIMSGYAPTQGNEVEISRFFRRRKELAQQRTERNTPHSAR